MKEMLLTWKTVLESENVSAASDFNSGLCKGSFK